MKVMIFAAGLGTRLKPLTDTMPKALVPINGKPLLEILLERLEKVCATYVTINVHHFAQQIKDYVATHNFENMQITISDESDELLDTGGGIKKALPTFETGSYEPILIHNVDILHNFNLGDFYIGDAFLYNESLDRKPEKEQMGAFLLVSSRQTSRYLLFNDDNRLVGWTNVTTGEVKSPYKDLKVEECKKYAFSGIHIINPILFPYFDEWHGKFSIIDFYLGVCDRVGIYCHVDENLKMIDVGKLDTLAKAEEFIKQ